MSAVSAVPIPWHLFASADRTGAVGKWPLRLPARSIAPKPLNGRRGPCPGCGGVARFRFDDRDQKSDFRTAVTLVADHLGVDPPNGCGVPCRLDRQHGPAQHGPERVHDHGVGRVEHNGDAHERAHWIWTRPKPYVTHPYLVRKGINACGTRLYPEQIVVPARDEAGLIRSMEFISPDGTKRFLRGGRMRGCYFMLGEPTDGAMALQAARAVGGFIAVPANAEVVS